MKGHKKYKISLLILVVGVLTLTSCKNNEKQSAKSEDEIEVSKDADTVKVEINASDQMRYDRSTLDVYEGQTVILTLNHTGKMPKSTMGHNFVLLKQGVSKTSFDRRAQKFKDNDYIPEDTENIIAHTKLLGGGERATITFEAPAAGDYDYLCSFPGHEPNMNGVFTVHKK